MTGYLQGFPKNRGFHRPEPVSYILCCPVCFESWKQHPTNLAQLQEAFLKEDATTPGLSDIFCLQEGVTFPVLSPLPDAKVLEEVTPPPNAWIPWKPPEVN